MEAEEEEETLVGGFVPAAAPTPTELVEEVPYRPAAPPQTDDGTTRRRLRGKRPRPEAFDKHSRPDRVPQYQPDAHQQEAPEADTGQDEAEEEESPQMPASVPTSPWQEDDDMDEEEETPWFEEEPPELEEAAVEDDEEVLPRVDLDEVPKEVRERVRRVHANLGHPSKEVLLRLLRLSGANQETLRYARYWVCPLCAHHAKPGMVKPAAKGTLATHFGQ